MKPRHGKSLFDTRLAILKAFHKEHGHCRVPKAYDKCPRLYKWIQRQIDRFHARDLDACQAEALANLGIDFYPVIPYSQRDVRQRLEVLARYRRETKTTGLPTRSAADPEYVAFAQLVRMRRNISGDLVSDEIIGMLKSAGIDVDRRSAGNGMSAQEEEAFGRNFSLLRRWLHDKERRGGGRDLTYRETNTCSDARTAYRFVEHMQQKRRQDVLALSHLKRLISLAFTVNGQRWFSNAAPGPSIRSVQYYEERL